MKKSLWIISSLTVLFPLTLAQDCTSPNGFYAQCIPLGHCRPAYDFMRRTKNRPMSIEVRQFIGQLQCRYNFGEAPHICCATNDPNFISLFIENGTIVSTAQRFTDGTLLPKLENYECGVDFLANRIFGGSDIEINEYPWMALLQYEKPNGSRDFGCGGSLINQRYVLTAAHCVIGKILSVKGRLVIVRLGEYNLETLIDCEVTDDGSEICAPPVLDMVVEWKIAHPRYSTVSHDIGLVRFVENVPEISNIYPICMPPASFESPPDTYYIVAGWGRTPRSRNSKILQKLVVPMYNFVDCQYLFAQVDDKQICAGGEIGKDSCNGDSGGPLMTVYKGVWIAEGITSFGLSSCGIGGVPGIYTRVSKYIDWIQSNLEP